MDLKSLSEAYPLLLPALIFCARLTDVSIGTLRIIAIARGKRWRATYLGFIEILIWLFAIGQIMSNLTDPAGYIAYALGYASGNYLGLYIEGRLAQGTQLVRLVTKPRSTLVATLRERGFRATSLNARGEFGPVSVVFAVVERARSRELLDLIRREIPNAFFTIEDVREVHGGYPASALSKRSLFSLRGLRKSR